MGTGSRQRHCLNDNAAGRPDLSKCVRSSGTGRGKGKAVREKRNPQISQIVADHSGPAAAGKNLCQFRSTR